MGEKPLAIIAVLQYLSDNEIFGKRLLELINDQKHAGNIRKSFINLAEQYSILSDPSSSWSVNTGSSEELQNAIRVFRNVDESFSKLTLIDIKSLVEGYLRRLEKRRRVSSRTEEKARTFLKPSFTGADKTLGPIDKSISKNVNKMSDKWLNQFRNIILHYNKQRISDPFMEWFREQEKKGYFTNVFEKVLIILIDARFDQQTTAEKALENTIRVFKAGMLKKQLERDEIPLLSPRRMKTSEEWTHLFYIAIPNLYRLAKKIGEKRRWSSEELLNLMGSPGYKVPYLGVKTSRLAVRWLHELISDLNIDMSDFKIPVDVLVYRVASRLGLIDPRVDKYYGKESPADLKIQSFAKRLFPENPWFLDEALWSTGRQASKGGHCYPSYPKHDGCIFEEICSKKYVDFNPSEISMGVGGETKYRTPRPHRKPGLTDKQKRFSAFVQQLKDQGVRGEEYRRRVKEWYRNNP